MELTPSRNENATLFRSAITIGDLEFSYHGRNITDASCVRLVFDEIKRKFPDHDGSDK